MSQKLRVWWIPQVPMQPFLVEVSSVQEAKKLLAVLADYDIFQYENNIKPDYSNTGGLEVLEQDRCWTEWYGDDGESIDDLLPDYSIDPASV